MCIYENACTGEFVKENYTQTHSIFLVQPDVKFALFLFTNNNKFKMFQEFEHSVFSCIIVITAYGGNVLF
jgi:hypothetical protein